MFVILLKHEVFVNHFYFLTKPKVHTNSMKKLNRKQYLFNVFLFDWFILKVPCKTFWHKHNFQKWFSSFRITFVSKKLVWKITLCFTIIIFEFHIFLHVKCVENCFRFFFKEIRYQFWMYIVISIRGRHVIKSH